MTIVICIQKAYTKKNIVNSDELRKFLKGNITFEWNPAWEINILNTLALLITCTQKN